MEFVSIYHTVHSFEIEIIRNLLEENDIKYQLPDEATQSAAGMAGLGMAGMRVMVPKSQREQAIAILKERGFS
ncbi:putative signal transducing protein [Salinimicrobium marinum]|nr:DUF2007 domain-containing protein [Salinimicrobium marinum]